jgi:hypothetical protein
VTSTIAAVSIVRWLNCTKRRKSDPDWKREDISLEYERQVAFIFRNLPPRWTDHIGRSKGRSAQHKHLRKNS